MSPNVGNFVHDLVEMAKAMETLPQVEQALREAEQRNRDRSDTIDSLRADLEQSRTYAATLEQKVRTVEAERDDAEIRFLELDEKANQILAKLTTIRVVAMDGEDLLSPPKPQPELVPANDNQPQADQSEALPTHGNEPSLNVAGTITTSTAATGEGSSSAPQPPASQGSSEVNPTIHLDVASASDTNTPSTTDVKEAGATNISNASTASESKPSGPYTGKRYVDVPGYVSFSDWVDGGGTDDGYWQGRS